MIKKTNKSFVISRREHEETVAALNKVIETKDSMIEYQKTEWQITKDNLNNAIESSKEIAASYANLKRESEMEKARLKAEYDSLEARYSAVVDVKNSIANTNIRLTARLANLKWYHLLFNIKTKG